ncbi:MAG: hypothetical protein SPM09_09975 [Fibrobacter sp.]|uniref:hypothetical protein n=1 Tax=Fibrobacter sp. TaxID=35828 RepID=UPI002A912053|nr:hypothetical protein [Fibrobacter sp.]MDY6264723.1 hypothetical protein [Fibrobacter sp.]
MNLKTSLALTLASVAFAMAQDAAQPATSAAEAPAPAVAEQPAAAPAATAPAAPESVQPAPAEAPAEVAQPTETAAPAAVESAPVAEPAKTAAPAQPAPEAKVAEAVPPQGPVPEAAPGEAPVRMGPPKTPFTVLHGNAYNRVQNEAAGDNVDALLNKRLTKLAYQKFFYIEPTGEKGVVSLGGFFGAMDISGELGRATAGYATPGFAIEARLGLGQIKTETKGADIKETVEGDDWGLTLSKTLGGYVVTLSGDWITFAKETNVDPVRGPKTEQRYRDLDASLIVTDGPSARKHFWSAGVAFNRHEDELESGGTLIGDSLTSNFTVVPLFNYGTPVLRANYANVYMGLNASVPVTVYDKADMRDSTSGKYKEASLWTVGVNLAPNILGEVLLTESLMLFGEASYTWEAFRYVDNQTPYADVKVKRSVADKVEATMGLRYQYKDWAACEFAFGDSFFTDTKSIFNGEGVFVSFGGFIYF